MLDIQDYLFWFVFANRAHPGNSGSERGGSWAQRSEQREHSYERSHSPHSNSKLGGQPVGSGSLDVCE